MEHEIVARDAFLAQGVSAGWETSLDVPALWDELMERESEIQPFRADGSYFGVDYQPGDDPECCYLAAIAVSGTGAIGSGLTAREVPPGLYAEFACTVDSVAATHDRIHTQWLPRSGYEYDHPRPALEIYPADTTDGSSEARVYVPIRPVGP